MDKFLRYHGHETALTTTTAWQRLKYAFWGIHLFVLLQYDWKIFLTFVTGALALFYLATILYKLLMVLTSVVWPGEIRVSCDELDRLEDAELPVYTVLIPLYKEAAIADLVAESVKAIDYPQDKLDVILLLEEDDKETQEALARAKLPASVRTVVVPQGRPKTKPRACDYGLDEAKGKYLVIYDAEDRPEPDQIKKAVVAFRRLPDKVICLQAKLNYYNPDQNWLTKWFTLEYTTWFDLFLPGLNRLNVPIPLGGTSNHFKTTTLRKVGGWDPFNVAEDCDLGMRLHKAGFRTRVIDSTTWEEANSRVGNWIRQRSRWVKGYIQTHLVHTREPLSGLRIPVVIALACWMVYGLGRAGQHLANFLATRADGEAQLAADAVTEEMVVAAAAGGALCIWGFLKRSWRFGLVGNASFLLTVGGLSLSLLLNPVFWIVGIAWLYARWRIWYPTTFLDDAGLQINYWSVASHWFWGIAVVLLAANAVFILIHLIACAKRKLWHLSGYALFVPFYWVLISVGAWRGFLQLFTRAHHWDKTVHGLSGAGWAATSGTGGEDIREKPTMVRSYDTRDLASPGDRDAAKAEDEEIYDRPTAVFSHETRISPAPGRADRSEVPTAPDADAAPAENADGTGEAKGSDGPDAPPAEGDG